MKRKIILCICIFVGAGILGIGGTFLLHQYKKQTQPPISMIIASDIHYLSPDYRGEYFKEPAPIFDGKLTHYSPEYFEAFLAEVVEKQPELLILSGDLTLNGSIKSHNEVASLLKKVQDSGIQVLVIPGNHDIYSTAGDYTPEEPVVVESALAPYFMEQYEEFGPAQALSRDTESFSYIYEATPYLRILMLDTNTPGRGSVAPSTLEWVEKELKSAKRAGADVIAVTHQNLHIHSELLYFGYQLFNADELLALYEKYDVKLNLSGHVHVQSIVSEETTPGTTIPEIAVGSLATGGTPYGELTYDGKTLAFHTAQTDVSTYAVSQGWTDENLLDFNNYSYWYFEEVGRLQTLEGYKDSSLTAEEINLLADTFAKINSAYFTGAKIDTAALSDGIALWETQTDGFFYQYIQSMLNENNVDNQNLILELN